MRIEFFGLPGTGKSYLCRQLIQHYAKTDKKSVHVNDIIEDHSYLLFNLNKLRRAIAFCALHPIAVWGTIKITTKYKIASKRQLLTKLINLFAELQNAASVKKPTIIEQGVLQAIWSLEMLSESEIAKDLTMTFSKLMPTQIIVIEPPDNDFYINQLANRDQGRSHFDTLSEEEINLSLERANKAIKDILGFATQNNPEIKLLRLVNDHQIEIRQIDEWVDNEVDAQRSQAPLLHNHPY